MGKPKPPLPSGAIYLWRWFQEIIAGEQAGYGPSIVTWTGLSAWAAFMKLQLEPWEASALVALGNVRAKVLSEDEPENKG